MKKWRFVGSFVLLFALLLVVWERSNASHWYTRGLLASASIIGPAIHGWVLETDRSGSGRPMWVDGDNQVYLLVQFDALAVGVVPALALLAATPGLGIRRRIVLIVIAAMLCFAIDTAIVVLFPVLVFYKNPFTDVLGTFLGLIAFVGAPVIIWFALTFRQLQQFLPRLR
jgi:hypothetical protein